jgi:hypothetical protein
MQLASNVSETHNHLINGQDWTRLDFLQPIIPTLIEDCSQPGIGPNGPGLLGWALKTMYYWYKTAIFYLKMNVKLRQGLPIFSDFLN